LAFGSHDGEIAETRLVGKMYTFVQSLKTYSNSPRPRIWMSHGMDLIISVLFSKSAFKRSGGRAMSYGGREVL
jgi:hypothetical protein